MGEPMEKLYRIPDPAQEFMHAPALIEDGSNLILRYDYETEDCGTDFRDIIFVNCTFHSHQRESEITYTTYRQAYNAIASDGTFFYIFFDGYGLYTIRADTFIPPVKRECFEDVIKAVRSWTADVSGNYPISTEVLLDTDSAYRVILESKTCMGELLVCIPDFAPYRYVSFQILSIGHGPVYTFFDDDSCSVLHIIKKLNAGLMMLL